MDKRLNLVFLLILILILLILFTSKSNGQDLPAENWTLLQRIDESEDDIKNLKFKISKRKYTYYEERIYYNSEGQIASVTQRKITDFERQIGLKILDLKTGKTAIIIVQRRGRSLISPTGYDIQVVKRQNGIEWNGKNTHLKVIRPESHIVIKIAWPDEKTKKNLIYTPYSTDDPNTFEEIEPGIHTPEIVAEGVQDLNNIFTMACQILRDRDVRSKAFPEYIVCDLPFLSLKAYQRLLLIEHMDESEFNLDPQKTVERVLVILRTNRNRAFATCNSTRPWRACGSMQFTNKWTRNRRGKKIPGTYSTVVRDFPKAKLVKDFPAGAFDHINAAMAAILLIDYNLEKMAKMFGQPFVDKLFKDPIFAEFISDAPYNGSPSHTHNSLRYTADNNFDGWSDTQYLPRETRGYLRKNDYLIKNNLP